MDGELILDTVMGAGLDPRIAPDHSSANMATDPAFLNQFLMESSTYGYSSPSVENPYGASEATAWPVSVSLPSDGVTYSPAVHQEDKKPFSTTSPTPEAMQLPLCPPQLVCQGASPTLEGVHMVNVGPVPMSVNGRQSSCESSTKPFENYITSPDEHVASGFPPTQQNTNTNTNTNNDQAPRLRSLNTKRRTKSKYGSPDACGAGDGSSDNSLKPRPAHNKAERNYRRRLNSSFEKLLDVMNLVAPKDPSARHDADSSRELSKGDVLRLARHQLVALEMENRKLREELRQSRMRPQRTFSWSGLAPPG